MGKGKHVILFRSVPISKAASLRYFQTLFLSSVGHENFKSSIYWPSTPLQVKKKKWPAGLQRNLGERRDWGWRERQDWSLSVITLMKKDQKKPGEETKRKAVKHTKINPQSKPPKLKPRASRKKIEKMRTSARNEKKIITFKKWPWQTHATGWDRLMGQVSTVMPVTSHVTARAPTICERVLICCPSRLQYHRNETLLFLWGEPAVVAGSLYPKVYSSG